ncbi:hypothetical protein Lal_00045402 [Lupinus albus]|uniref:Putative transcription factor bZIP family n=1 Tax=Lupinus albus TaxID=3870 RepID=A0A6A5NRT8_LUPAL|nr:putative transcription factor bZIP family [Lupinus albus]KAF1886172.1 hypothetical protein Lal_00045402 [Lupinus albus]
MFFHDETVQFSCSTVLETMLTPGDKEELLSLIHQSRDQVSLNSGSQGSNRTVYSTQERKTRRMESNRESARRSRWRKKRHAENIKNQVNRLRTENRELKNRLGLTMHHHLLLSLENENLISESMVLIAKLTDLIGILNTMLSQ